MPAAIIAARVTVTSKALTSCCLSSLIRPGGYTYPYAFQCTSSTTDWVPSIIDIIALTGIARAKILLLEDFTTVFRSETMPVVAFGPEASASALGTGTPSEGRQRLAKPPTRRDSRYY
jgi:hypothetical protein